MGVQEMLCESCETTSRSEYLLSIVGLNVAIFCFANCALLSLLINSSVFPENIEPQITSIHPDFFVFSENIFVFL